MSKHRDDIDRLVEESLRKPKDDYRAPYSETCKLCGCEWHGETNGLGCPGQFATDEQAQAWRIAFGENACELVFCDDNTPENDVFAP